jgi:signal peptidase I
MHPGWRLTFQYFFSRVFKKTFRKTSGKAAEPSSDNISSLTVPDHLLNTVQKSVRYTGFSMYPTFRDPEFLVFEPVSPKVVRPGDIIVFEQENLPKLVIHRVLRKTREGVITKGDNNERADPEVIPFHQIKGVVRRRLTKGKEKRVWNVPCGILWMRYVQIRKTITHHTPLKRLIDSIRNKNMPRVPLPTFLKPIPVLFKNADRLAVVKVLWFRRVIGKFDAHKQIWEIPVLLKLFTDIRYLNTKLMEIQTRHPELFKEE